VSWHQARAYARWLARRLPSEAEWERAVRGERTDRRYPWGNSRARDRANVFGLLDDIRGLAAVGSFPPTAFGLYDLPGNVWEWCEDSFHLRLAEGPPDGSAWTGGGLGKVVRGGSWRRSIELTRVSARSWQVADYAADDLGFRCAASGTDGEIRAEEIVSLAATAFHIDAAPGQELREAQLVATDRRYLERRAMTWLVLEGRPWDAAPLAAAVLAREPRDRAALEVIDGLESAILREARSGVDRDLSRHLEVYRTAMGAGRRLVERRAVFEKELVEALLASASSFMDVGDRAPAAACYRLALQLEPDSERILDLMRGTFPEPGARRRWLGDGREMVWIPGGSFLMGKGRLDEAADADEQPAHTVWVRGFWLDRTEVTNGEYRACVAAGACTPPHDRRSFDDPEHDRHPVLWVDWYQARGYAQWAGKRLPTEAEWEYAARAGSDSRYPWGEGWTPGRANSFGTRDEDVWGGPAPVASFPANQWGVVDLLGNAWEWVEDTYHSNYRGAPRDGRAWYQITGGASEPERVLRGGSFANLPAKLRVSQRDHRPPESPFRTTGFRCAADAEVVSTQPPAAQRNVPTFQHHP
jgi:formylglycine-generating enzyme required for sulfatase activity